MKLDTYYVAYAAIHGAEAKATLLRRGGCGYYCYKDAISSTSMCFLGNLFE